MADSVESPSCVHETRSVDTSVDPAGLGAGATVAGWRERAENRKPLTISGFNF